MSPEKMIRMANQIATFFATQPGNNQPADIAKHIKAFWDPRMLDKLYAYTDAGGEGLSQDVISAVGLLRQPA